MKKVLQQKYQKTTTIDQTTPILGKEDNGDEVIEHEEGSKDETPIDLMGITPHKN